MFLQKEPAIQEERKTLPKLSSGLRNAAGAKLRKRRAGGVLRPLFFTALFTSVMAFSAFAGQKTKVACIGDSLTRGYLLTDAQSYPAQLQTLLGDPYEVRNFGHTSSYVIDDGPIEYRNTEDYSAAIQDDADILIFMFGSNDVGAYNFTPLYFENQYRELIDSFRKTKKNPKIYLIIAPDSRDLHFGLIQQTVQPVMSLGQQLSATVINPYYLFFGHS